MEKVVVVGAVRTAVGTFGGALKDVPAGKLGALAIKAAVARANIDPGDVEQVVFGCVGQIAEDAYISRVCTLGAGLPKGVPAVSVNRLCGSGLQAINQAYQVIVSGDAEVVVAGGVEVMSRYPYISREARWGLRLGNAGLEDALVTVLSDPFHRYHMAVTAENLADKYGISRADQDAFALESQHRTIAAIDAGRFKDEIVPVEVPAGRGQVKVFDTDEHPKRGTSLEKLAALRPAFKAEGGTVTAGNASGINDGAAAVVLMTAAKARALGVKPLAELVGYATSGVDPAIMGIGPVPAIQKALRRTGLSLGDIDLIELNEAFAAQSLAVLRELALTGERVNVNGGAIALGHPVGATGAIITVKLLYELQRRGKPLGLASLCIGGGQGIATIFKNVS